MILQITRSGTVFSGSTEDLERLRQEFDRQHCILLPELFEPGLLQMVQRQIDRAEFYERLHGDLALESCMRDEVTDGVLHFLVNDQRLFEFIEQITGCNRIGCFAGRVYRVIPGRGHYYNWHEDIGQNRMITMSINMSTEVYGGGVLQIRDRESGQIFHEVANTGFGDGIIFRLAPHLQHRLTDIEGTAAKTAFVGWFRSQPDHQLLLTQILPNLKSTASGL